MIWLRRLFDFYIDASIHVALAACSLTLVSLTKFNLPVMDLVLCINFCGTILGYNFVKYATIILGSKPKTLKLKAIIVINSCALVTLFFCLFQLPFRSLVLLSFSLIVTVLYAFPFFKSSSLQMSTFALRAIPGLKVYVIAFVWGLVTVLFPVLQLGKTLDADVIITFVQVFLLVVVLMIPFEIRDLNYDKFTLKTLPQLFGVRKTKILGIFLCFVVFILDYLKNEISQKHIVSTGLFLFILSVFIFNSKKKQSIYYSSFWIESLPVVWLFLLRLF
jgi:hypothetical protein